MNRNKNYILHSIASDSNTFIYSNIIKLCVLGMSKKVCLKHEYVILCFMLKLTKGVDISNLYTEQYFITVLCNLYFFF